MRDLHATVAIPHAARADLLDPGFEPSLIVSARAVVISGRINLRKSGRAAGSTLPTHDEPR